MVSAELAIVEQAKYDPNAFGLLYDRYVDRIYRFVCSRVHERCLAEDITEEVFLNALKSIPNYRDTGSCFSAWLYRIAGNAIVSHYRGRKTELDLETVTNLAARTEGVLDAVVRRDDSRRIWRPSMGCRPNSERPCASNSPRTFPWATSGGRWARAQPRSSFLCTGQCSGFGVSWVLSRALTPLTTDPLPAAGSVRLF